MARALRLPDDAIGACARVDDGPAWIGVVLGDARTVLAVDPDLTAMGGLDADVRVRALVPRLGIPEDPVTGSLNASLAQWLIPAGVLPTRYVASQGTALGRAARVQRARGNRVQLGGWGARDVDLSRCVGAEASRLRQARPK